MTTIEDSKNICTLINVFSVEAEKQQELFDHLKVATETIMNKLPGYISANIHVSDDKKTVTNYAQWSSLSAFQEMLQNSEAQAHMKKAAALAIEFKPVTYNKIWTHSK